MEYKNKIYTLPSIINSKRAAQEFYYPMEYSVGSCISLPEHSKAPSVQERGISSMLFQSSPLLLLFQMNGALVQLELVKLQVRAEKT